MILAIPVVDGHDITDAAMRALVATVGDPDNFTLVIIDNNSETKYKPSKYERCPFKVEVIGYPENKGFYAPLIDLFNTYPDTEIGLMHNDVILYEPNWDIALRKYFTDDPLLGLVGLCGSNEIDNQGGRGMGTMCNFVGAQVQVGQVQFKGQDPAAGRHINWLEPAVVLDSLFMMFGRHVIPSLVHQDEEWDDITLAHFYDRIWPCRVLEAGFRVAVAPFNHDHIGGLTTTGNERYRQDCIKWLDDHKQPWRIGEDNKDQIIAAEIADPRNQPSGNPETEMYLIAERRFLGEYKDQKKFIPLRVNSNYEMEHLWSAFN